MKQQIKVANVCFSGLINYLNYETITTTIDCFSVNLLAAHGSTVL